MMILSTDPCKTMAGALAIDLHRWASCTDQNPAPRRFPPAIRRRCFFEISVFGKLPGS